MRPTADSVTSATSLRPPTDYNYWTIEELRALGTQLQVPDARRKTRAELLEILDVKGHWERMPSLRN
jgi:hypothetical protein